MSGLKDVFSAMYTALSNVVSLTVFSASSERAILN